MTTPTQAERMRGACADWLGGMASTAHLSDAVALIPLPTPTPLEAARDEFVDAWMAHRLSQFLWVKAGRPESGFVSDSHWRAISRNQCAADVLLEIVLADPADDDALRALEDEGVGDA